MKSNLTCNIDITWLYICLYFPMSVFFLIHALSPSPVCVCPSSNPSSPFIHSFPASSVNISPVCSLLVIQPVLVNCSILMHKRAVSLSLLDVIQATQTSLPSTKQPIPWRKMVKRSKGPFSRKNSQADRHTNCWSLQYQGDSCTRCSSGNSNCPTDC